MQHSNEIVRHMIKSQTQARVTMLLLCYSMCLYSLLKPAAFVTYNATQTVPLVRQTILSICQHSNAYNWLSRFQPRTPRPILNKPSAAALESVRVRGR